MPSGGAETVRATSGRCSIPGRSDVVIYYSGHGVPGLDDGKGYLLPVDVPARPAQEDGYPIELLYAKLGELARGEGGRRARSVRVYLDACFSGLSYAGALIEGASPMIIPAALPEGVTEKRTVLSAAEPKQTANWDKRAKHGLFTQHLLDALYGKGDADGKVTAAKARRYLDDHMTHDDMTPAAWLSRRSGQRASLLTRSDGAVLSSAPSGCFPGASGAGGGPGRGRVGGGRRRAGQKFGGARHVRARAGAGAGEEGSCGSSVLLRQARAARRSAIGGHGLLSGGGGVLSGPPRRGA